MKEKTEQGRSVNIRLTQSEYAEYVRLGGVKLFLDQKGFLADECRDTERELRRQRNDTSTKSI
jgi:hypothetical protein